MELEQKVEEINRKVDNILLLIRGNDLNKEDSGLVGTVNDIDERVIRLEKFKDRMIAVAIGMTVPAGIGIKEIFDYFKHIL